nr:hypothetical protein [Tanacetum cinerariifolium]
KPDTTSMNSVQVVEGKKMTGEQANENGSDESVFEDEDYIYTQSVP